jgi:hypothetical protein
MHQFACHMSGSVKPATCAGFLLRGATHNIGFRLALITGKINPNEIRDTVPLHHSYRAMAIANGVASDDPALQHCHDPGFDCASSARRATRLAAFAHAGISRPEQRWR